MKYKIGTLAIIIMALSSGTVSQPEGNYCGDILGNKLYIDVNSTENIANVTANIFGDDLSCPKEHYQYNSTNTHLYLPKDPNDCLNKILSEYGVCPCPPNVVYAAKSNQLTIEGTQIGSIILKSC